MHHVLLLLHHKDMIKAEHSLHLGLDYTCVCEVSVFLREVSS